MSQFLLCTGFDFRVENPLILIFGKEKYMIDLYIILVLFPVGVYCLNCHILGYFCMNSYHLQCLGATLGHQSDAKAYVCSYCQFIGSGSISRNGGALVCTFVSCSLSWRSFKFLFSLFYCLMQRFGGKRPELNMLIELLSDAEGLCVG